MTLQVAAGAAEVFVKLFTMFYEQFYPKLSGTSGPIKVPKTVPKKG